MVIFVLHRKIIPNFLACWCDFHLLAKSLFTVSGSIVISPDRERLATGVDVGDIDILKRSFEKIFPCRHFEIGIFIFDQGSVLTVRIFWISPLFQTRLPVARRKISTIISALKYDFLSTLMIFDFLISGEISWNGGGK